MKSFKKFIKLRSLFGYKTLLALSVLFFLFACNTDECAYIGDQDCDQLGLNIGDACSTNNDGNLNGTVNDLCECIEIVTISECPGFIQNGDFENLAPGADPNASVDQDIDLALSWKRLWNSGGSLADLFNASTVFFGSSTFVAPTPASGVFAGMWIENSSSGNATFREGMFNELTAPIGNNTGSYTLSFDYAKMSTSMSNDVKVGIYGVNFPTTATPPPPPTGIQTPSNLDLYGSGNSVLLGEVIISNTTTNTYTNVSFTVDTNALALPSAGINHIMITNSHLVLPDFGRMFLAFDNFCMIN